ncbi:hypothetical protein Tcan_09456 [Toxocara canis]|uniref:Uncharacterized protein n=1 Tax=Toxocara canis TaxID=6265 RepID=A0A0B2W4P5_TOXCA|nr:hypothetical protein Tcan_09456 [Toxocara canis]
MKAALHFLNNVRRETQSVYSDESTVENVITGHHRLMKLESEIRRKEHHLNSRNRRGTCLANTQFCRPQTWEEDGKQPPESRRASDSG